MNRFNPGAMLAWTALVVVSAGSLRAEERMRAGLWESAMTSDGKAGLATTRCVTPAEIETTNGSAKMIREYREKVAAKGGKRACTLKDLSVTSDTITAGMDCGASSFVNKTTYHGDSFETVITFTDPAAGKKTVITGRRIGACR